MFSRCSDRRILMTQLFSQMCHVCMHSCRDVPDLRVSHNRTLLAQLAISPLMSCRECSLVSVLVNSFRADSNSSCITTPCIIPSSKSFSTSHKDRCVLRFVINRHILNTQLRSQITNDRCMEKSIQHSVGPLNLQVCFFEFQKPKTYL